MATSTAGTRTSRGSSAGRSGSSKASTTIMLSEQPSFDMLVLGCGGGPAENDLSAYWIKPAGQAWLEGFVSVDGGSCLGALIRLLDSHPDIFRDFLDHAPASSSQQQQREQQQQASASTAAAHRTDIIEASTLLKAGLIYEMLKAFLITHAHWDHISGLVLSSSSGSSKQRAVYGSKQTISNLSSAMDGGLWPVLGSHEAANGTPYIWREVEAGPGETFHPSKGLSAFAMPLSHGMHHQNTPYKSTGFFIENDTTNKSLLVFGDVEADSVSGLSLNRMIWRVAAQRISEGRLSSMLIECSYCSSRPREQLYGHLSPIYIAEELRALASLIPSRPGQDSSDLRERLQGVTVCIVHVKDPTSLDEVLNTSPASGLVNEPSAKAFSAPAIKKARTSPTSSTPSTPSRRTRSTSAKSATVPFPSQAETRRTRQTSHSRVDVTLPEGIKHRIYNELQELESRDQLGVRYLMLEQGMRIAF